MKRKYIKPLMESELFVANEYVSACFFVKCPRRLCDWSFTIKGTSQQNAIDNYLSTHSQDGYELGDAGLHKGQTSHNVFGSGDSQLSTEKEDQYYHTPTFGSLTNVHHQLVFYDKTQSKEANFS